MAQATKMQRVGETEEKAAGEGNYQEVYAAIQEMYRLLGAPGGTGTGPQGQGMGYMAYGSGLLFQVLPENPQWNASPWGMSMVLNQQR